MVFGFAYMVIIVGLGMFLASQLQARDPNWANSPMRHMFKAAHAHGNLEGLINIVVGFLICRYGSVNLNLSKAASALAIVAAIFHSGVLFLGGLGIAAATSLAPVGAIAMVLTAAIMAYILWIGVTEE